MVRFDVDMDLTLFFHIIIFFQLSLYRGCRPPT